MKISTNLTGRLLLAALLLVLSLSISACHRSKPQAAKRYPFIGRVISIDSQSHSAMIDGDNIPGFMDAMAMDYKIKPESMLKQLTPGDKISAEVVVIPPDPNNADAPSDYWLENVKVTGHDQSPPAKGSSALHMPVRGEEVPDFSFTNQDGKHISLAEFRGHVLLVTFIYTRCPFPDYCPRMSANFNEVYQQLDSNPALKGAHLLSVSFDPEHDTPKVLRDYGYSVAHTHNAALFRRWQFAAPRAADLLKIAEFFALSVTPDSGGTLTHSLSTTIIGSDGKVADWYHGNDWQVSDLIKDAADAQKS